MSEKVFGPANWRIAGPRARTCVRFIAIGPVRRGLVLVVYTERSEDTVRIISARWAIEKERALYLEYMEKRS